MTEPTSRPDGAAPAGMPADGANDPKPDGPRTVEVARPRRAPRFRAFLITGAALGFALGLLVAVLAPGVAGSPFTDRTVAGFLGMALGLVGTLVGGAVAVLVDRRSARDL